MALECKNCGGSLVYNIDKKKLQCKHCDSKFDVGNYKGNNDAKVIKADSGYNMDVFICRNCGAELCAPKEQLVAYCSYCGSEAMELSKSKPGEEPKKIVPFSISLDTVKQKYAAALKKKFFVPDEFLDPEYLSEFRGIYVPYWSTKVTLEPSEVSLKGTKRYTVGDYDYYEEYDIEARIQGDVSGGYYDASAEFDDTVAAEVAPFKEYGAVNFKEGYLAGFYADTVTTSYDNYVNQTLYQAYGNVRDGISKKVSNVKLDEKPLKKAFRGSIRDKKVTLMPVWFLTWKRGNRVAYSVMNGQTGKLSIDLPIDYKKFFLSVGVQAIIYWAIISLMAGFVIPLVVSAFASVFLIISSMMFSSELRKIRLKEQHIYDYGYNFKSIWKKAVPGKEKNLKKIDLGLRIAFYVVIAATAFYALVIETPDEVRGLYTFMMILQSVPLILALYNNMGVKNKNGIVPSVLSMAAQYAGIVLAGSYHPQDYWYFIIALICMAAILCNILTSIYYLEFLTTRPVPNFFKREGAQNE